MTSNYFKNHTYMMILEIEFEKKLMECILGKRIIFNKFIFVKMECLSLKDQIIKYQ